MMDKNLMMSKFDSIEAVTNQALDSFNRMRLSDAEDLYLRLIQHMKGIDNNKKSLIKCFEGLAEVYIKHSSRLHIINKLEWQWMNIQAIILLQHAIKESNEEAQKHSANEDYIWFCDKRDSLAAKLRFQEERLVYSLQESIVFEERPDVYITIDKILGEEKDKPLGVGGWLDKLQTYCKNRLAYGASNMGRVIEIAIAEPKIEVVEKKTRKTADYFRERYNQFHQKLLFHSPMAIKYGLNQLDKSHSMSLNCLDQYHSVNTVADIQNQNCGIGPKRPQSLNVKPIIKPSPEQQVKKAVEYLKKKAEALKKKFVNTPVVSWRGIVEQHKNILDETLDDFKVDYNFTNNGAIDENDNCPDSEITVEESRLDNHQHQSGNYVNQPYSRRTKGDNIIEYDEESVVTNPVGDSEEDTGFCRDRVVNPLAFASSNGDIETLSRGEKRKHDDQIPNDSLNSNSNSSQNYSQRYSYQRSVYTNGAHMTETMRAAVVEYKYDSVNQHNKSLPALTNSNSEHLNQVKCNHMPSLIEIETIKQRELKVEQIETSDSPSPQSDVLRRLGKYASSQTLPIEDLSPHEMRTYYRLHTFEECSPVTETSSLHFDIKRDLVTSRKSEGVAAKSLVLPIDDENIQLTLAHSVLLMADKLFNQGLIQKASSVYEKALGLFHAAYKGGGLLDENMANILKKLGIIRTRNGDIIGGVGLMEQAMRMLNVVHKTDMHIRIAEVWYEMGNAYIIEHLHGETLRDHVILTIRDELNAELLDYAESDEDCGDDEEYDGRNMKNSYSISTYEALTCYQHALAILKDLQDKDKVYTDLMAKVLTKLGDCSVITDNFDRAVQYYEKALNWFPNARERSSLPSNAHVICMLGVVRFLIHRYAKAGALFQCAQIMYQHIRLEDNSMYKFEVAYVLSLLSFSHYASKQYYKATSSALKAIEIYTEMYQERIPELDEESFWLINQTIYTLGYAYLSVDSYDRALNFLQLAKEYSHFAPNEDRVQIVQILKAIGDCYEGMEKHEIALGYYCDALHNNDENGKGGMKSSSLQNLLLSKTAGMHVSMHQYEEASDCLDQARVVQIDMADDIRGDLVSLLHQLGQTHTLACEVDKAMECYLECIEAYEEDHESLGPEMSATYGNLATLCHVKACMTECGTEMQEMLYKAENYYQIAVDLEFSPLLALKYANYLFHQRSYIETILIVQQLLNTDSADGDVIFSGIEQVVAPELIQLEIEEEEIVIPAGVFSKFLLVVCYCHLNELDNAEYYVIDLMGTVYVSESPLLASILGYCVMELGIFSEARFCFERAIHLSKDDYSVAMRMICYCLCLELYEVINILDHAQFNIYEYYYGKLPYYCPPAFRQRRIKSSDSEGY